MYKLLYEMNCSGNMQSKWLLNVKSILNDVGLSFVWDSQEVLSKNSIKYYVKQILQDQFVQK